MNEILLINPRKRKAKKRRTVSRRRKNPVKRRRTYAKKRRTRRRNPTARGMVNYTALVVHKGRESREADAYIKAWAKGGKAIGEYGSSDKALSRAYELCPQS